MGDAQVWIDVVGVLFCLGILAFVAVTHQRRRRLALQTNQPQMSRPCTDLAV
jgi:hypothetical protein